MLEHLITHALRIPKPKRYTTCTMKTVAQALTTQGKVWGQTCAYKSIFQLTPTLVHFFWRGGVTPPGC